MNLDQKNFGLILSADISWRQLMSADDESKNFLVQIHFLTQVYKMCWKTADWDHCQLIFAGSTLAITQPQPWFLVERCVLTKKWQLPSVIKVGQLIQQLQPNYFSHFKNLKTWTVTKPIIRFRPNFSTSHGQTSFICGSNFIPFYLAVSEIIPLFHFKGPHCTNTSM